ncbi:O-mannose kinase [Sarcoptes scabiei]|nr:O-mannose kinase [Sarcoptes scabiei]
MIYSFALMGCGASSTNILEQRRQSSLLNSGSMMIGNSIQNNYDHQQRSSSKNRMILSMDGSLTNEMLIESGSGDNILNQNGNGTNTDTTLFDKRNVIQLFNNLENSIQTMEKTKCFEKYRIVSEDIEQLKEQIQILNDKSNEYNTRVINALQTKDLSSAISLCDIIVDNLSRRDLNPSDVFLVKLFNNQKINQLKINLIEKDISNFEEGIKELQIVCDQLHDLYQQRDTLLNQMFDGNYDSEKEIQLEQELDSLMEERHYIEIAKIRWINSDHLIIDSLKCFDQAIQMIHKFLNTSENEFLERYTCIKESRNNIIEAHYKLMSLHNNLQNVQLPHFKIDDLKELATIASEIFNDLTSNSLEELIVSLNALRAKTVTQHKWIKEVLNRIIKNDLVEIRDKCRNKSQKLCDERIDLMKQKQEQWKRSSSVEPVKNDSPFDLRDSGVDSEIDDSLVTEDQFTRILASGKESLISTDFSNATPLLPGEGLAPIPTNKEIFGDKHEISKQ